MQQTLVDSTNFNPKILHCFSKSKLSIHPRCSKIRNNFKNPTTIRTTATVISSPSNSFIKHCLKLRQSSSYRHSHASVLVVGLTPIREISRFQELQGEGPTILDSLLLLNDSEVPKGLYDPSVRIVHVSSIVMKKLSGLQSIDSVEAIALMRFPSSFCNMDGDQEEDCESWFPSPHRILVLDGIQDGVFLLPGCCDPFNDKALRAARGASFQLPIVSGKWAHLKSLKHKFQMKMLAGHPDDDEERNGPLLLSRELADVLAGGPLCLVLGSEGRGLSEESMQACELVSIPMAGEFESLNVSVAGGIFLFMLQPEYQRVVI
ncbi:uncharacterized protein LOC131218714 isoform X2 [Magnolia sinica]|uniref:uncharacterized protein LOC131218714 isoform X2 n=1 Tax=Magnolia sinica TaxID=86752 RepID=UPI002658CA7E|nr:uncharacterized protein LOC131218714 isoform X2 [Magnolia sinica]